MAHSKSAIKRWHQSLKRRDRNRSRRTLARGAVRQLQETVVEGDEEATRKALSSAYSALDVAAKTGSIGTRRADRTKRRLAALVRRTSETRGA